MRTVTFKSVLDRALKLSGIPVDEAQVDDVAMLTEFINMRLRTAWEAFPWPERTRLEERFFRADYAAGTTYAEGDEVYYPAEDSYYRALGATTGNAPTNTTYWEEADDDLDRYVAWEQTGLEAVDAVFAVWDSNPRLYKDAAEAAYSVSDTGVEISPEATVGTSVWLEYGARAPEMTDEEYDATATYVTGDRVYFSTDGKCYEANQACAAGDTPATDTDKWDEVEFPYILASYCAMGAYRDFLKGMGQTGRSRVEEADVDRLLQAEVEKVEAVQGRRRRLNVAVRERV